MAAFVSRTSVGSPLGLAGSLCQVSPNEQCAREAADGTDRKDTPESELSDSESRRRDVRTVRFFIKNIAASTGQPWPSPQLRPKADIRHQPKRMSHWEFRTWPNFPCRRKSPASIYESIHAGWAMQTQTAFLRSLNPESRQDERASRGYPIPAAPSSALFVSVQSLGCAAPKSVGACVWRLGKLIYLCWSSQSEGEQDRYARSSWNGTVTVKPDKCG